MSLSWNDNYIAQMERTIGKRVQAAGYHLVSKIRENISTAGTTKAGSGFTGQGRHYTREQQGPVEAGASFVPGGRSYINAFGVKDKKYKKGRRIYGSNPSKPGEFPHKQFGRLRQSIAQDFDGHLITRVGTNLAYGRFLELGTRKMAARPFLRRTLSEENKNITAIITTGGTT